MDAPKTAREALIAEVLGDLGRMIDNTQTLVAAMNEAHQSVTDAQDSLVRQLAEQCASFELQMTRLSEKAKTQVVTHIVARADEACRRTVQDCKSEMRDAMRTLLGAEIELAMTRLALPLRLLSDRKSRACEAVLTHLAVAVVASALTWGLLLWHASR